MDGFLSNWRVCREALNSGVLGQEPPHEVVAYISAMDCPTARCSVSFQNGTV